MPPWFAASVCLTTLTTNGEGVKKCVLYYAKTQYCHLQCLVQALYHFGWIKAKTVI